VQISTHPAGLALPSVGQATTQDRPLPLVLPSARQTSRQVLGLIGAGLPSKGQYSLGQQASRQPVGTVVEPAWQTLTHVGGRVPVAGQALRQPCGVKLTAVGQMLMQRAGLIGPVLPSGHVSTIRATGVDVGTSVMAGSGQQASRQPAGSVSDPGLHMLAHVPGRVGEVWGHRSKQNAGRMPVSGHTVTH
jgi:hypothetical protein